MYKLTADFKKFNRTQIAEMIPYQEGDDLEGVSISDVDKANGSPKRGDMIARNPKNHADQWLVAEQYFKDNFGECRESKKVQKTFGNTTSSQTSENVKDVQFWGEKDQWKLISKAWSDAEGWMKSTKAMEIEGQGCVIQVTTQQEIYDKDGNVIDVAIAEAVTSMHGTRIDSQFIEGKCVSRKIVNAYPPSHIYLDKERLSNFLESVGNLLEILGNRIDVSMQSIDERISDVSDKLKSLNAFV